MHVNLFPLQDAAGHHPKRDFEKGVVRESMATIQTVNDEVLKLSSCIPMNVPEGQLPAGPCAGAAGQLVMIHPAFRPQQREEGPEPHVVCIAHANCTVRPRLCGVLQMRLLIPRWSLLVRGQRPAP